LHASFTIWIGFNLNSNHLPTKVFLLLNLIGWNILKIKSYRLIIKVDSGYFFKIVLLDFFSIYYLILSSLRIKFHNLFWYVFCEGYYTKNSWTPQQNASTKISDIQSKQEQKKTRLT